MVDDSIFDKRGEVGSSPWHWGEGTQYLPIHDVDALAREFDQHNGEPSRQWGPVGGVVGWDAG